MTPPDRPTGPTDDGVAHQRSEEAAQVDALVATALTGLSAMYRPDTHELVQTVRGAAGPTGPRLVPEGSNLRYAAIVALGLHLADPADQRRVLQGETAASLTAYLVAQAGGHRDPGAVALVAWAAAEVSGQCEVALFARLLAWLADPAPLPTVDVSWMLTAAVAARGLGDTTAAADTTAVADLASRRLLTAQGPQGLFPHVIPAASQGRWRAHVGCFADQVYPVQALARYAAATSHQPSLAAANACAATVCALQGPQGQWWWHYDVRDGSVVEGFPVYSVHQHAMGPMALLDLLGAGGDDHRAEVALGMGWLETHPEVLDGLVDERLGVVWRKVGRREPPKAVRRLSAVTTSLRPGLRLPGLDRAFPPAVIDHECRPYELGWLLYSWLRPSGLAAAAAAREGESSRDR